MMVDSRRWPSAAFAVGLVLLWLGGCAYRALHPASVQGPSRGGTGSPVRFTDVTREAGIRFVHNSGARGKKYFPETCGSGCAFFDYDGDGWLDILLVNSMDWPGSRPARQTPMALYRNRGDGTFEETTRRAGLAVSFYGIGCAAGDYDNDGHLDLYLTAAIGPSRLFRNRGDGTFDDVTRKARVDNGGRWGSSAAWLDFDGDGYLDLFVGNYVRWSPETDIHCESIRQGRKSYCTPEAYPGESCRLYRNNRNGTFTDVTQAAGMQNTTGKTLGVVVCDFDRDSRPDVAVANDTQPNFLYHNLGGRFREVGMEKGIAYGDRGLPRAGMGIDVAEAENNGKTCILVSNFSGEGNAYFRQEEPGHFVDAAAESGMVPASLQFLGWGTAFADFDLDGWQDVLILNGHINPDVNEVFPTIPYAERPLLFRQRSPGRYEEVGVAAGLTKPYVGRGLAVGDYDNDGDPDLLVTENNGPAHLLRNEGKGGRHWLRLKLNGRRSNRSAIGTRVIVHAGGVRQALYVKSGGSYASHSDLRLLVGLGEAARVEAVEIRWPSGRVTHVTPSGVDRELRLIEPGTQGSRSRSGALEREG